MNRNRMPGMIAQRVDSRSWVVCRRSWGVDRRWWIVDCRSWMLIARHDDRIWIPPVRFTSEHVRSRRKQQVAVYAWAIASTAATKPLHLERSRRWRT